VKSDLRRRLEVIEQMTASAVDVARIDRKPAHLMSAQECVDEVRRLCHVGAPSLRSKDLKRNLTDDDRAVVRACYERLRRRE
jgi:hypothetical protein